jgi:thiamine pyrophosphate-dependent acetolactate synthase large subunit-like protein
MYPLRPRPYRRAGIAWLPCAIGAQAAYPGRQVVVFTGDGSLTFSLS